MIGHYFPCRLTLESLFIYWFVNSIFHLQTVWSKWYPFHFLNQNGRKPPRLSSPTVSPHNVLFRMPGKSGARERNGTSLGYMNCCPFPLAKCCAQTQTIGYMTTFSLIQLSLQVQSKEENDCHRSKPKPSFLFNGSVTASGFLFSLTVNSIPTAILFCY